MEYSKEDLMEAKKQIWGVGENMGTEESKKIWEENAQFWDNAMGDESNEFHREVVLEKIVLEAINNMADFVRCHESIFLYMIAKKNKAMQKAEFERLKKTVADSEIRLAELDKLMAKLYEDNVLGRVKDDFYEMMMKNYEREQKELTKVVADGDLVLQSSEQKSADTRLLIRTFREMTDISELTPIVVNKLIERIEVHNNDKSSGHCYVKVDIYFTGVGMISIPSAEELIAMMEDIRKNPEAYRLAA